MQEGRSATIEVGVPGHVKIHAVAIARSAAEAEHFQRLAEQVEAGQFKLVSEAFKFEAGALVIGLEIETDDHEAHVEAEKAAAAVIPAEDQEMLNEISGSGGLAAAHIPASGLLPVPEQSAAVEPSDADLLTPAERAAEARAAHGLDPAVVGTQGGSIATGSSLPDPTPAEPIVSDPAPTVAASSDSATSSPSPTDTQPSTSDVAEIPSTSVSPESATPSPSDLPPAA